MTILKLKDAIITALRNNNNYAALTLALAIPDICGKLQNPEKNNKERYVIWFDEYLKNSYQMEIAGVDRVFMNATDCYALRCAILHEASGDITSQKAQNVLEKIKFTTFNYHRIRENNVLLLNVREFCLEICDGIDAWFDKISSEKEIMSRINAMLKIIDTPGAFSLQD